MANSSRPQFDTLVDQIKIESRVKGADNLDLFIGNLVNELLLDYAQKNRYFEFLVVNNPITTYAATSLYNLPDNFMHPRLVRYKNETSGYTRTLHPRSGFVDSPIGPYPRYYELTRNQISVYPFEQVPAGDTILIDYYQIPDTLLGTALFPVPKLVPTIKLEAIHRVHIYNNQLQQAAALRGEAVENEARARPTK
jgi:hypothetical protein